MSSSYAATAAAEIAKLHGGLQALDYYEFLAIDERADYIAIREAYHTRAQRLHPDRLLPLANPDLTRQAYDVLKRITEAYTVLFDPELRRAYDRVRMRGAHRLSIEARSRRLDPEERQVSNVFARLYLRSARTKLARGDINGAWIDAELGLSLEPSPPLRALRDTIVAMMSRPQATGGFS